MCRCRGLSGNAVSQSEGFLQHRYPEAAESRSHCIPACQEAFGDPKEEREPSGMSSSVMNHDVIFIVRIDDFVFVVKRDRGSMKVFMFCAKCVTSRGFSAWGSDMGVEPTSSSWRETAMLTPTGVSFRRKCCHMQEDTSAGTFICVPTWHCSYTQRSTLARILQRCRSRAVALATLHIHIRLTSTPLRPCQTLERFLANRPTRTGGCSHPGMGCSQSEKHQQAGWVCPQTHHCCHPGKAGIYPLPYVSRTFGVQMSGQGLWCVMILGSEILLEKCVILYCNFVTSTRERVISTNRARYIGKNLNDIRLNKMSLSINWYLNTFSPNIPSIWGGVCTCIFPWIIATLP